MRARVDMAKAAASIIMRRKLKGGAAAMQQLASQALLQAGSTPPAPVNPMTFGQAPHPGSVMEDNWVQHSRPRSQGGRAEQEAERGQLGKVIRAALDSP